jgi:hypothetical protein
MAEVSHTRRRHTPRHTETRVDHLCCRDQRRYNSDEAFRPCLQLRCSIEDRRTCLQILQPSLQKTQQRRKTWEVCKRTANYHSIGQVDELSDFGSECDSLIDFSADFCAPYCVELFDPMRISPSSVAKLNQQIAHGLHPTQWLHTIATIKQ